MRKRKATSPLHKTSLMKTRITTLLFCLSSILATWAGIPPRPAQYDLLCDYAHLVTDSAMHLGIETDLLQKADSVGVQILILTVNDLEGMEPAMYATEVGNTWGVGGKDYDNGIVMLIKPRNEHGKGEVFIATGFGNEGALPDGTVHQIVQEMLPALKAENYTGAILLGATSCLEAVSGEYKPMPVGLMDGGAAETSTSKASDSKKSEGEDDGFVLIAAGLLVFGPLIYILFRRRKENYGDGSVDRRDVDRLINDTRRDSSRSSSSSSSSSSGRNWGGGKFGGGGAGSSF